jgi:hypothetical protein
MVLAPPGRWKAAHPVTRRPELDDVVDAGGVEDVLGALGIEDVTGQL